ncbi:MAG: flagellar hook-associated protein FlgK [Armatimonadetes bacterium]|nr:flagellar hook-associated protein FlgK [Armatimonadota bacterium]
MPSTFFGLNVAQTGLFAQRRAMDILGYNVAHANDPTYKRQRLVLVEGAVLAQSQEASSIGVSPFGSGVMMGDVERVRNALIENRMRAATQACANWQYRSDAMKQLEATIAEPSDSGLQSDLDTFWASWQKVATSPESMPIRGALLEDAAALCQRMHYEYSQMIRMIQDLNNEIISRVDRINWMVEELAQLNKQISAVESGQVHANDLENRRDAIVVELSKLASVSQYGEGREGFIVTLGGRVLVQGDKYNPLKCTLAPNGNRTIQWASDGEEVLIMDGELKAMLDLRDNTIPSYLQQLDFVASSLVERVNAIHRTGKTLTGADGGDFFKAGTTAADIWLDDSIIGRPELVAASASGSVGDGDIAQNIAAIKDIPILNGLTINQLYRALVSDIGSASVVAERQAIAHRVSLEQYSAQQQSISGVSLDEEMTNMIKFQQAYNAAARMITVMDEMLSVMIEKTGVVGR